MMQDSVCQGNILLFWHVVISTVIESYLNKIDTICLSNQKLGIAYQLLVVCKSTSIVQVCSKH